jgi:thiol-disulfide isomerase/thioredoxin
MAKMRLDRKIMSIKWLMLAFIVCLASAGLGFSQQTSKAPAVHDPKVIDAAGYQKILDQYHGKPLLVTFWSTWCEPCRDEYPMLNELAKQYAPQGLNVVGINLNDDGDMVLMRRFMARYKPVFPNYRKKMGGENQFVQAVLPGWNGAIPASFFYAPDGRQVGHFVGQKNHDAYETAIKQLLSGGTIKSE